MRKFFPLLIGILLLAAGAFAQSQATTGNIEGRVVDPQGAAVPNVAVTAKSQDNGAVKTAQSSDDGNFVLPLLPPGNYTVSTAAIQGFGVSTYENVTVTVGAKTTLEINLSASGSVNVVDVNAEGQGVETTRTSISSTVEERRVINLPTNGRNFLDFVTLTPGIVRDPTRSGDLAVGGQKGTLNSLQIDGTSSDNTFFGQSSGRTVRDARRRSFRLTRSKNSRSIKTAFRLNSDELPARSSTSLPNREQTNLPAARLNISATSH